MHRRVLIFAAIAACIVAACTTTARREFVSDRISVITRGDGPDIILIPGMSGHRDDWGTAIDGLGARYRLHLVQVNGFAGVPAGANVEGPVSAPVAEEIARYITEQHLDRPAVIGHSMGGAIGTLLAARHPGLVGRVMILDMMPFVGDVFAPGVTAEALRAAADQMRAQILNDPPGEGMLGQMFQTMTLKTEMVPVLMKDLSASDPRTVANAFRELIATDLRPELRSITAPVTVLFVRPQNVSMSPEQFDAAMRRLYQNASNVRLVRIDDSRQYIHWDQPARFVSEVDAFMATSNVSSN